MLTIIYNYCVKYDKNIKYILYQYILYHFKLFYIYKYYYCHSMTFLHQVYEFLLFF